MIAGQDKQDTEQIEKQNHVGSNGQFDDVPVIQENRPHMVATKATENFHVCEFKQESINDDGTFSGYASVFDNIDLDGDVIERGAFRKSLETGKKIRLLSQHDRKEVLGVITNAFEDERGLFVEGKLTLEVQKAREMRALLKDGAIDSFSIGFAIKEDTYDRDNNVRIIKQIDLFEVSFVTFPANPAANVTSIKEEKTVSGFQANLPIASRETEWDSEAAIARVRNFTGSEDSPSTAYRRAFLWFDGSAPENFGSYKLPFVDVINDELTVIPRALNAANAALGGARGGVDIPEADKSRIRANIERYRAMLEEDSADKPRKPKSAEELESVKDVERFLRAKGLSRNESEIVISKITQIKQGDPVEEDATEDQGEPESEDVSKHFVELINDMKTYHMLNQLKKEISNV